MPNRTIFNPHGRPPSINFLAFLSVSILLLVLCACFGSVAWGQQPAAKVRNWRQFHRLNMSRWNPYEHVLNVHNAGRLGLKWSYLSGSYVDSSPAVVNGAVYIGLRNGLRSL
jgi:hypothetical protein